MISMKPPDKLFISFNKTIFRRGFHKTAKFEDSSRKAIREIAANRWQIGIIWFSSRLLVVIATIFDAHM